MTGVSAAPAAISNKTTTLYRLYDAPGNLLYVGISQNVLARLSQHRAKKTWWPKVSRFVIEDFPDRSSAAAAERLAIRSERPRYNIMLNGETVESVIEILRTSYRFYHDGAVPLDLVRAFHAAPVGGGRLSFVLDEAGRGLEHHARGVVYRESGGEVVEQRILARAMKNLFALLSSGVVHSSPSVIGLRSVVLRDQSGSLERVIVDLGEEGRAVVCVDGDGWEVLEEGYSGVYFDRSTGSIEPLVRPSKDSSYGPLYDALGFREESADAELIRRWLASAFIADTPRPVLFFIGNSGSGKTTASALVMSCVNPVRGLVIGTGLQSIIGSRSWFANSYLPGFDAITGVSSRGAGLLRRVVSGADGGLSAWDSRLGRRVRGLRTGVATALHLPPGCGEGFLPVKLREFQWGVRRQPEVVLSEFLQSTPRVMGAIFDDLSCLIADRPSLGS